MDACTGVNQSFDTLWARIKVAFDERNLCDTDFNMVKMDRNESALSHRWAPIQKVCNRFHGNKEEVENRPDSGKNVADLVSNHPNHLLDCHAV